MHTSLLQDRQTDETINAPIWIFTDMFLLVSVAAPLSNERSWDDINLMYSSFYMTLVQCTMLQCEDAVIPCNAKKCYVKKWNYRITVICLFPLAVNKLNSIQLNSIQFSKA